MKHFSAAIALCLSLTATAHADDAAVARGRYLAILGDCAGCHTGPGGKPFAGGLSFNAPFGTVYSTNITPDRDTGTGNWSKDDFYRALHDGVAPGGKHLYPALPYVYFSRITRQDTDDLYAYVKTLTPVHRPATPNQLMFPFNLRFGLFFWDLLYLDKTPLVAPANVSAQWKRGEYLVNGLGHCAACHSPKDLLFGDEKAWPFAGGTVDNWFAPNITGTGPDGLGKWSQAQLVAFLTTGHNTLTTAAGSMKEKVATSSSRMDPADVAAIAVYLKSLSSEPPPAWETPRREDMAQGQGVYLARCQNCHGEAGTPAPGAKDSKHTPPLAANTMVMSRDPTSVLRIILTGGAAPQAAGQPPTHPMPAFSGLDDGQIATVASYIRNSWGNSAPPVSAAQAHILRQALAAESH